MNKLQLYNKRFSFPMERSYIENVAPLPKKDVSDKNRQLLDFIYGVDPVNGLPTGDLACYLSDKTNPEVRMFIEQNLLNEHNDSSSINLSQEEINGINSKLTDDDIVRFSRNYDETKEEYAMRLKKYFDDERNERLKEREIARLKKILEN